MCTCIPLRGGGSAVRGVTRAHFNLRFHSPHLLSITSTYGPMLLLCLTPPRDLSQFALLSLRELAYTLTNIPICTCIALRGCGKCRTGAPGKKKGGVLGGFVLFPFVCLLSLRNRPSANVRSIELGGCFVPTTLVPWSCFGNVHGKVAHVLGKEA